MWKQGIALSYWLAMLSGLMTGATAWAKPADLPSNNQIECAEGQEPATRDAVAETPPAIDAVLPAFIEQWLEHAADALTRPDRSQNLDYFLSRLPYISRLHAVQAAAREPVAPAPHVVGPEKKQASDLEKQIRQLFDHADKYRRTGLSDTARFLYQRVHLLSPTSELGRLAIERLQELEDRLRNDAEEQDNPGRQDESETRIRDIRNGTIPLGLVRVTY